MISFILPAITILQETQKQKVRRVGGNSAVNYASNLNLTIISFIISTCYYVVIHKKKSEQRQYIV